MNAVQVGVIGSAHGRFGRDVLIGACERLTADPAISLRVLRSTPEDRSWFRRWAQEGISGFLCHPEKPWVIDEVVASARPFVALGIHRPGTGGVFVGIDNELVGEAAAHHLLERGFNPIGMIALPTSFSRARYHGFAAAAARRGKPCDTFELEPDADATPDAYALQADRLEAWLACRPSGSAVFCANDHVGNFAIAALRRRGIRVPDQVAVLGVDDDETLCLTCQPQLSSVILPGVALGRMAADALVRRLRGEAVTDPPRPPPVGIATRRSTDALAVPDPEIALAIRFIREHVAQGVVVEQVARAAGLSRRLLEQRFQTLLGRSPMAEIRASQVERARLLLASSAMPLGDIAIQAGFGNIWTFSRVFRQVQGQTPRDYRRSFGSG